MEYRKSFVKCHSILLCKNGRLFTAAGDKFVRRFSSMRPAVLNTLSLATGKCDSVTILIQQILNKFSVHYFIKTYVVIIKLNNATANSHKDENKIIENRKIAANFS